jgi:hypothetical protein
MESITTKQLGIEFLEKSESMTRSCVFPDFIPGVDLGEFHKEVMEVFKNLGGPNPTPGFRVWLGNVLSPEYKDIVSKSPPRDDEDFIKWSTRIFGDQKFGFVINYADSAMPRLSSTILHILQPILDSELIPSGGYDIALFAGNYGWTPFGIHKDMVGGKTIHFHLGPAPKVIYQWADDVYDRLTGSPRNYYEPEKILDHATKFEFNAGDLYFMDDSRWHVGYAGEISIGVAFWFNHFDRDEVFNRLNKHLRNALVDKSTRLSSFSKVEEDSGITDFPLAINNSYKSYVEKFYQLLYDDYRRAMLSNGGYYTGVAKRTEQKLELSSAIQLTAPFKILHRRLNDEQLLLFIRAHQVQIFYHEKLPAIIDRINLGEAIRIDQLTADLSEDWADEVILYFINQLIVHRGVDVVGGTSQVGERLEESVVSR